MISKIFPYIIVGTGIIVSLSFQYRNKRKGKFLGSPDLTHFKKVDNVEAIDHKCKRVVKFVEKPESIEFHYQQFSQLLQDRKQELEAELKPEKPANSVRRAGASRSVHWKPRWL